MCIWRVVLFMVSESQTLWHSSKATVSNIWVFLIIGWHSYFPPNLCYFKCGQHAFLLHCDWHRRANGRYHPTLKRTVTNNFLFSVTVTPEHLLRTQSLRRIRSRCVSKFDFLSISCLPLASFLASPPPQLWLHLLRLWMLLQAGPFLSGCKAKQTNLAKQFCYMF